MARRLPSLNALRAFEAAGRHLSFTRAAAELNVTQAAVSHHVKHLEAVLGTRLFRRLNRALHLTEAGQILLPAMSEGLDQLAAGVERVHRLGEEGTLEVSTLESIASEWLVPRLARFRQEHPDIDLRLSVTDSVVDFSRDTADMALRYGPGGWPGVAAIKLAEEDVLPVAAPKLLERFGPLRSPADLLRLPLLHEDLRENWQAWFRLAGVDVAEIPRGPFLPHHNLVLQAATAGEGVALGRSFLTAGDLASGRLVAPFDIAVPARNAYYAVYPEGADERPKVAAFRDWLVAQMSEPPGTITDDGLPPRRW